MRPTIWLLCAALSASCGFGDNHVAHNTRHACGDSVLDPGEGCDDGNTVSGDGCSATCTVESTNPVCGNGIRENGEACDDGNTLAGDGCSPTCTSESVCGNGIVETGEDCDDHNTTSGDGCSPTCHHEPLTACGLIPQSGCSGATPACDLTAADDGSTECRAVTTQGTSNSHCTVATACKAGYTCVGDGDPNDLAVCSRFCTHDSDCLGTGSRCVDELYDDNGNSLNIDVCSNACDVYGQTGCPTEMGCLGHNATGGDFTDCAYMDGKLDGATCASSVECLPGSTCVDDGIASICEPYCVVGNNSTCDFGDICVAFVNPLEIGTVEYGACQ